MRGAVGGLPGPVVLEGVSGDGESPLVGALLALPDLFDLPQSLTPRGTRTATRTTARIPTLMRATRRGRRIAGGGNTAKMPSAKSAYRE